MKLSLSGGAPLDRYSRFRCHGHIPHLFNQQLYSFCFIIVFVTNCLLFLLFEGGKLLTRLFKSVYLVTETLCKLKIFNLDSLNFLLLKSANFLSCFCVHTLCVRRPHRHACLPHSIWRLLVHRLRCLLASDLLGL